MKRFSLSLFALLIAVGLLAQQGDYKIEPEVTLPATPVKDQGQTGTCWSFATTSFIESEALRLGGDTLDLSEMFFVRMAYLEKAIQYVDSQARTQFSEGGLAHDVQKIVSQFGIVPQSAFAGLPHGEKEYNHTGLQRRLEALVKAEANARRQDPNWLSEYQATLDNFMGTLPCFFNYGNKWYTPAEFAREVAKFKPADYVEITSFTHHPYYAQCTVEVPDNWPKVATYYNLPLDELMEVMKYALRHGFSISWDGDTSEKEFKHRLGIAVWPEMRWDKRSKKQQEHFGERYEKELEVTPEIRQAYFEDQSTTDDHLMHLTGLGHDSRNVLYFRTKNSWAADSNTFGGYLYMSEQYLRAKTIAIFVHKDAIPKEIRDKLKI